MFSGREQGPDPMNRTPSFSSILLFSFDAEAVRIFSHRFRVFVQFLSFDNDFMRWHSCRISKKPV